MRDESAASGRVEAAVLVEDELGQRVATAIRQAAAVYQAPDFLAWARAWELDRDRSAEAAEGQVQRAQAAVEAATTQRGQWAAKAALTAAGAALWWGRLRDASLWVAPTQLRLAVVDTLGWALVTASLVRRADATAPDLPAAPIPAAPGPEPQPPSQPAAAPSAGGEDGPR